MTGGRFGTFRKEEEEEKFPEGYGRRLSRGLYASVCSSLREGGDPMPRKKVAFASCRVVSTKSILRRYMASWHHLGKLMWVTAKNKCASSSPEEEGEEKEEVI